MTICDAMAAGTLYQIQSPSGGPYASMFPDARTPAEALFYHRLTFGTHAGEACKIDRIIGGSTGGFIVENVAIHVERTGYAVIGYEE